MPMRMRILLSLKYCAICAELKLVYVGGSSCATTAKQPNSTIIATPRSHRDAIELERAAHKWIRLNAAINLDAR
jgi:hypothetical protein